MKYNNADDLDIEAEQCWFESRYSEAELLRKASLRLREELFEDEDHKIVETIDGLAWALHEQGKYGEAETYFRRSLKIRSEDLCYSQSDISVSLRNVAMCCHIQSNYVEAELLYQKSIEIAGDDNGDKEYVLDMYNKLKRDMSKLIM